MNEFKTGRWPRFSLLLSFVILSGICVLLARTASRAQTQAELRTRILREGGTVWYEDRYGSDLIAPQLRLPRDYPPLWDWFHTVKLICLKSGSVSVHEVTKLPDLEVCHIEERDITVAEFRQLSNLRSLKEVELTSSHISADDVHGLLAFSKVKYLRVNGSTISVSEADALQNRFPNIDLEIKSRQPSGPAR